MAPRLASSSPQATRLNARRTARLRRGSGRNCAEVVDLLQPGSFVKLRNQPEDLPPFELIRCRGGRCWVRQQAWGSTVQWEVAHRQLTTAA
jgi:hypothetical protein